MKNMESTHLSHLLERFKDHAQMAVHLERALQADHVPLIRWILHLELLEEQYLLLSGLVPVAVFDKFGVDPPLNLPLHT